MEPVVQATCRDHTKTSFLAELVNCAMNDVHNVLCLTGDSYAGSPKIKQVFDMDSALMLYEARYLRERARIHFTGEPMRNAPRPFLGAAINPFTTPANVPVRRLKQKVAAGADFIQTQLVFDIPRFAAFMATACDEGLAEDVFVLAGVPVVTSRRVCEMLPHVPGVHFPEAVARAFHTAADIRAFGIAWAREAVAALRAIPGVSGVHLMLMGPDHAVLPEAMAGIDASRDSGDRCQRPHSPEPPAPEDGASHRPRTEPCPSTI
jgi:5,10-methylenetetrahydrofolate reductase